MHIFISIAWFNRKQKVLTSSSGDGLRLCQFPHFYYVWFLWKSVQKNVLYSGVFRHFFAFLQILLQLNAFSKNLSMRIILPRTRHHLCAKFDVRLGEQNG